MNHFGRNLKDQSWKIICDRTEAEVLKYKLFLQLSDEPCPFQNPPYIKYTHPTAVMYCNIIHSRNETKIRESAEFIRKRIDYPFAMFCAEYDRSTRIRQNSFLHTPHGELYRYNNEEFELAYSNRSEVTVERRVLESSKASLWVGKLPSYVTDQDYLYLPSTEEGIAKMRDERSGKWMIYTSRSDMATHDNRFLAMVTLFQKGIFVGLKAATAMANRGQEFQKSGNRYGSSRDGVLILCYTADSEDKEDVLRAAQAIQGAIEYECIIYYKTNSASIEGQFQHEGKRSVNKYMHTVGGGFYEKDDFNRFKLVD